MKLNFSEKIYLEKAKSSNRQVMETHTNIDAFLILLKDVEYKDLDYFCHLLLKNYDKVIQNNFTEKDVYNLILNNQIRNTFFIYLLLPTAYECIAKYKTLGSNTIQSGKINTSEWISHSLYEAQLTSYLAEKINLNPNISFQMGLLHDIGRKKTHDFSHVTKGYEILMNNGFEDIATCTLTHSFLIEYTGTDLKGSRCANCDAAEDGFYVKDYKACYTKEYEPDDISLFLDNYNYTQYDLVLNIADLMATGKGIVSPAERIRDIATRKIPDARNRNYFLVNLIYTLLNYLELLGVDSVYKGIQVTDITDSEKLFQEVSELFFTFCNPAKNKSWQLKRTT